MISQTAEGVKWSRLGVQKVTGDRLVVKLWGTGNIQADGLRLQQVAGEQGVDDNFRVSTQSLTIDAGDPTNFFSTEPGPNGGRINLGHTGNTIQATTSPAQLVQVLSPNGLEKLEQGQPVSIKWRSVIADPGGTYADSVAATNALAYYRLGELSGTTAVDSSGNGRDDAA